MVFNKPYRLVVIDDDESTLNLIWKFLSKQSEKDITFSMFTSGDEALEFIDKHQVHIVITDIHLESSHGSDIISHCMALEKGLQIIGLSADQNMTTAIDCFNRGAKYLLEKPINKQKLSSAVDECIAFIDRWHENIKERVHSLDEIQSA